VASSACMLSGVFMSFLSHLDHSMAMAHSGWMVGKPEVTFR